MAVSASLRALLNQAIDYAGMFPPCDLPLEPALQNHAKYVRSPEAWMLNGFVLPVRQFDAATKFVSQFDPSRPLRVAALGPKTANAEGFLDALKDASTAVRSYSRSDVNLISVSHLEMFLPDDVDSASLKAASAIVGELPVFWEAPPERAEQTIALIAEHKSDEDMPTFGYKLRTGGVTADAFPTSAQIARAGNGSYASAPDKVYGWAASSNPAISRRSENEDARISQCARSRSAFGRASMGRRSSAENARGRRSGIVFVYRRFLRVARLENRYGTTAIPPQIREVFWQL